MLSRFNLSLQTTEDINGLLGIEWLGSYQRDMMEALISERSISIKAPRQVGKSSAVRLFARDCVLAGLKVGCFAPTQKQAHKLLVRPVNQALISVRQKLPRVKAVYGGKVSSITSVYNTGGSIEGLGLQESAEIEGPSFDVIIVDEAHRVPWERYNVIAPMVSQAIKGGYARRVATGIGGTHDSLIEASHMAHGWTQLWVKPEEVLASDPRYQIVLDELSKEMSARMWAQHIECKPLAVGPHQLYPHIEAIVRPPIEARAVHPRMWLGIDVGATTDETVVWCMSQVWDYYNLIDVYKPQAGENWDAKAMEIFEWVDDDASRGWLWHRERIGIEINGLGRALWGPLKRWWPDMKPITINAENKEAAVRRMEKAFEDRKLGVREGIWRNELQTVQMTFRGANEEAREFTHSDLHSAGIIASIVSGM